MARKKKDPSAGAPEEFERALSELERIVQRLDREELGLEEALTLFEAGITHLRTASRRLDEARGAVEELIESASGELAAIGFEVESAGGANGTERANGPGPSGDDGHPADGGGARGPAADDAGED